MLQKVYRAFGINEDPLDAIPFGSGLINHTWKVMKEGRYYVLQRINDQVFRQPADIAFNISLAASFLKDRYPGYLFVSPELTTDGKDLYHETEAGYFRLSPFVDSSHTIDVVEKEGQAYEAARQFGLFTKLLGELPVNNLRITLPDFHNLSLRYKQFEDALIDGNPGRIDDSAELIDAVFRHRDIVDVFEKIKNGTRFRIRATHHDTKISNVLFDEDDKGLCVIDLDTLMPGYFISDFGDMMRTYLSPVSEEEKDFTKITVRESFFKAIVDGYLAEMKDELSMEEKEHLVYAGKFMIYMQAIRFLTDHLNDDRYYGAKYEGHNFVRAANQLELLRKVTEKEMELNLIAKNAGKALV